MEFHVKKLDFGSIITEDVEYRKGRTRGMESGEKMIQYLIDTFEQKLKSNKLDEFIVTFDIKSPPPKAE